MADEDDDKTEEPTGKRQADAKERGDVPRSRELNTFVMMIVSATFLLTQGAKIGIGLLEFMRAQFQLSREVIFDPLAPLIYLKQGMTDGFQLIAPFIIVLLIFACVTPISLGGWVFSLSAIAFKPSKLNPITGISRIFTIGGLVELLKSLVKILLVFAVAVSLYRSYIIELLGLGAEPIEQSIGHALDIISKCVLMLCSSLLLVALIDVPYQFWSHSKKMKMSKQEVKDENKQAEGSPEIKGRQRRAQMEMRQRRMMAEVPKADVIVTNPSHYAVALKYDQNSNAAPKLIAKGVDLIAAQIRNTAIGANVPLVAAPPLARALYYSTEIDEEIPQGLYLSVAQILAYVYQLNAAQKNNWRAPLMPEDISIPDEFKRE
jgi:flagellar biosynthetic protein FlhB